MSEVNVEKIMEEIRAEARKKGEGEYVPGMEELPTSTLRQFDWTVSSAYPVTEGNPIKRIYTKIVSKLIRCVTFPLTKRVTKTNQALKGCIDEMTVVIEGQQKTIRELEERVAQLEKKGAAE